MISGLYTSEAAMQPMMARMEVIANNLANINSTGFKRDRVFIRMLTDSTTALAEGAGGELAGVETTKVIDFAEGSLHQTGNPFDLAIQGSGFFVLDTPLGVRYTRNGNFKLNTEGVLVTGDGYPVMASTGRVQIPRLDKTQQANIRISEAGEVTIDKDTFAKIRIVDFDRLDLLKKDEQSMFIADSGEQVIEGPGALTSVRQGFLEESNVEGINEMIEMIELHRHFEMKQKAIQAQSTTLEQSNEVGKV